MPDDELSLGYLMHWGARLLRRLADRKLKPLGLSSAHLPVINALAGRDALSQKALAEIAAIEQPTMAATLARMERDRIIERRPDPNDKRSALFSLTPATRKKLGALQRAVQEVNREALHGLPEGERRQFRDQLETMIRAMEKLADADS
ncbi:MAG TPA: MarR family transcriptional regulator [Stellaceae bacterium]|jgi:DNA-binding MarR family transcriptional regulator|nr:MarR family transcriptional regulator [Stellaceae bacterium]